MNKFGISPKAKMKFTSVEDGLHLVHLGFLALQVRPGSDNSKMPFLNKPNVYFQDILGEGPGNLWDPSGRPPEPPGETMRVMSACVYIVQCAQSRQVFTLFTLSLIKIERKVDNV